jgi:hypothetical protein
METMYTQMMAQFGQENESSDRQRELDRQMDEEEEEEDAIDCDVVSPEYEVSPGDETGLDCVSPSDYLE